jgi:hypothetical protein
MAKIKTMLELLDQCEYGCDEPLGECGYEKCNDCDQCIHEVCERHPGDFVCVFCDQHFHDGESQEVHDHIADCTNRSCIARGVEPPFPVRNPIEVIMTPQLLRQMIDAYVGDMEEKQN